MSEARTPRVWDAREAMGQIIDSFAGWVRKLATQVPQIHDQNGLQRIKERVRDEG